MWHIPDSAVLLMWYTVIAPVANTPITSPTLTRASTPEFRIAHACRRGRQVYTSPKCSHSSWQSGLSLARKGLCWQQCDVTGNAQKGFVQLLATNYGLLAVSTTPLPGMPYGCSMAGGMLPHRHGACCSSSNDLHGREPEGVECLFCISHTIFTPLISCNLQLPSLSMQDFESQPATSSAHCQLCQTGQEQLNYRPSHLEVRWCLAIALQVCINTQSNSCTGEQGRSNRHSGCSPSCSVTAEAALLTKSNALLRDCKHCGWL
jgi:hypothetical protein